VLEHVRFPVRVAQEIARVLAPAGLIYVQTPNWISTVMPSFGRLYSAVGSDR
jgi:2-polyprenyl-3-methyl-5-hydroxy-6-metoxy-1,4-benzoquinol methylase